MTNAGPKHEGSLHTQTEAESPKAKGQLRSHSRYSRSEEPRKLSEGPGLHQLLGKCALQETDYELNPSKTSEELQERLHRRPDHGTHYS